MRNTIIKIIPLLLIAIGCFATENKKVVKDNEIESDIGVKSISLIVDTISKLELGFFQNDTVLVDFQKGLSSKYLPFKYNGVVIFDSKKYNYQNKLYKLIILQLKETERPNQKKVICHIMNEDYFNGNIMGYESNEGGSLLWQKDTITDKYILTKFDFYSF